MIILTKKPKTLWQHVYSFLGFWHYTKFCAIDEHRVESSLVIYWCCFPFYWIRKIDLFSIKRDVFNVTERMAELEKQAAKNDATRR